MLRQAVILAGGKGTRLNDRLGGQPKPLVDLLGVPLLERQVLALRNAGIAQVIVLVNHLAEQISQFCAAREHWGIEIQLINDGKPRGTGGAVLAILDQLDEEFLIIYGDTLFDVDFSRFYAFHAQDLQAAATLLVHPNDHPADSDIVLLDTQDVITGFCGYPHPEGVWLPNMVNAAMYILRRTGLKGSEKEEFTTSPGTGIDFAKYLFPRMLKRGLRLRGYVSPEYIKDIGTPLRLDRARHALASGFIARSSLSQPQKAIFFDRDGTLNEPNGYISSPDALHVYDFAGEALRMLHNCEYRTVLVTNQPVLARGECGIDELQQVHAKLETVLGAVGAFLDRIYYCPHHPDTGFAGEVASLKIQCDCRKPMPGMLLRAIREMNIDPSKSWMIGDSTADLLAARRAGVTSILVATGEAGFDGKHAVLPDFVCTDALEASHFITKGYGCIRELPVVQQILTSIRSGEDWFIAGQARSGKSTLANLIARELRSTGKPCEVINLDRWVQPSDERADGFLGRHDMGAIFVAFKAAQQRRNGAGVSLALPMYLRGTRSRVSNADTVDLTERTVVLWEGVTVSEIIKRQTQGQNTVFVDAVEDQRRERVINDLIVRGSSAHDAVELYALRQRDEVPAIANVRASCAYHVDLSGALHPEMSGTCTS